MRTADKIRRHGREHYVSSARDRGQARFSIRVGDVVKALGLTGRVPAVCSALKTRKFLAESKLKLVDIVAPKSGQSTTVIFTYEFLDQNPSPAPGEAAWARLRGGLKDVFAALGGGEAYLRAERGDFYGAEGKK